MDAMFTIVDLLCESGVSADMSLETNGTIGAPLTRFKCFDSILPADATLFHTTPRRAWVITMMCIDPDQPGLDLGGEAVGFTDVLCPQACPETILARIC